MNIGILGTGSMADALASKWASKHQITVWGRTLEKAEKLSNEIGNDMKTGSLRDVVFDNDVIVIAVHNEAVLDVLDQIENEGVSLSGKVVIDINNPVDISNPQNIKMNVDLKTSLAEQIAEKAPGARVIKAYNMCQARVWKMDPPLFDGRQLDVPICGDDEEAKKIVTQLNTDIGCTTTDFGSLVWARNLEHAAAMVISLLFKGYPWDTVYNLVTSKN